jgi:ectoine hydroxylase-related dioxygenase (phytanoyl-CoA dioxygenase family)
VKRSLAPAHVRTGRVFCYHEPPMLSDADRRAHLARIERDGYAVVEDAIEPALVDALRADVERVERELAVRPATNAFEGTHTLHTYNLLAHGPLWQRVPVHEHVLPLAEAVLDPGLLVSSLNSITVLPAERAQPLHCDDVLIPIPKPHPPVVCNSIWALTDFSEENGATRVVPGSHRADHSPERVTDVGSYRRLLQQTRDATPVAMRRGSVLVYDGSLWHAAGANRTREPRVAIAMNYCAGYIRQQENQQLGIPRKLVRAFPPRLRELVGYGVYSGLIGHIGKESPLRLLGGRRRAQLLWDE